MNRKLIGDMYSSFKSWYTVKGSNSFSRINRSANQPINANLGHIGNLSQEYIRRMFA